MSEEQRAAITRRCVALIDNFAHRSAIREQDLRFWLREVVALHGEQAVWHAARAGGFGGSDIGVLVKNHAGVRADHMASARAIVESKLLRRLPDEDSSVLRRGHENEPRHAEHFYKKYGAVRDTVSFDKLKGATGPRLWMRYSPDELAFLPSKVENPQLGGRKALRMLGDYKAPSVVDPAESISIQYACQLHQGWMICQQAGIHLDGMILSQFDWARWDLKDDFVPFNSDLEQAILQAGDHYWDMVLRAEIPGFVFSPRFEDSAGIGQKWAEQGSRLARLKALSTAIEKEIGHSEGEIKALFEGSRLSGLRMSIGDLAVSAAVSVDMQKVAAVLPEEVLKSCAAKGSSSWDGDAMAAKLRSLGVDVRPFKSGRLDAEKTFAALADANLDAEDFMKESLRLSPPKHFAEDAADILREGFPRLAVPGELSHKLTSGDAEGVIEVASEVATELATEPAATVPVEVQVDEESVESVRGLVPAG